MESERAAWAPPEGCRSPPPPPGLARAACRCAPTSGQSLAPQKHLSIPLLFFLLAEPECNLKQKSLCPWGLALPVSSPSPEPCCDLQRHLGLESRSWR